MRMTLRIQENARLMFRASRLTGKGQLQFKVGKTVYDPGKMSEANVAAEDQYQMSVPAAMCRVSGRRYWRYRNKFYSENEGLDERQVKALLDVREGRRAREIQRAEQVLAMGNVPRSAPVRGHISDEVKHFIWTRDQGRCRHCGSTVELQFDHVIPVAHGGASSPENLQVLCGPCNRRKGAGLTPGGVPPTQSFRLPRQN